jgi:hypothetical protein
MYNQKIANVSFSGFAKRPAENAANAAGFFASTFLAADGGPRQP